MGAGSALAGLGLAGHDPIAVPAAPVSNVAAGAPLFDPLTKSYPLSADGADVEESDPVWQEIAHRLGIPLRSLSFAPEVGIDVEAARAATPSNAQRTVEDVVKRALAPMIEAGTAQVARVELKTPWSGKWDAYVKNLTDSDAAARAFASPKFMALPEDFYVPSRQDIADQHARDVKIRQPGANTGPGSLADLDGRNIADHLLPVHANAVRTYHNTTLADSDLASLQAKAVAKGLPALLPASGGSGHVIAVATSTGVFIAAGAVIKDDKSNLRFKCVTGKSYVNGETVPIVGIDTGPGTNLAAGISLRWESPPPGLGELAIIQADTNGNGLTGGSDQETADGLRDRIADADADPAAGGNAAQVRKLAKDAANANGIPMEEVFVYSGVDGTNTYAFAFTVRPARSGGSRAPNDVQVAQVLAFIVGELPHGDGIFPSLILDSDVELLLRIRWTPGATGWADLTQYPQYSYGSPAQITTVTSALAFQVSSTDTPQIGQTIGFYNAAANPPVFSRKKILTVTGTGPFDLTIDTSLNVSDLVYVPTVGERFCPWSDSLPLLLAPVWAAYDGLGPGEQFDDVDLFDPGERLRRNPAPPVWPNELTHRVTNGIDDVGAIADVSVLEPTLPMATPTGTPTVSSNILTCGRILAFP